MAMRGVPPVDDESAAGAALFCAGTADAVAADDVVIAGGSVCIDLVGL